MFFIGLVGKSLFTIFLNSLDVIFPSSNFIAASLTESNCFCSFLTLFSAFQAA